jgi:hypothetical protein
MDDRHAQGAAWVPFNRGCQEITAKSEYGCMTGASKNREVAQESYMTPRMAFGYNESHPQFGRPIPHEIRIGNFLKQNKVGLDCREDFEDKKLSLASAIFNIECYDSQVC